MGATANRRRSGGIIVLLLRDRRLIFEKPASLLIAQDRPFTMIALLPVALRRVPKCVTICLRSQQVRGIRRGHEKSSCRGGGCRRRVRRSLHQGVRRDRAVSQ